MSISDLQYRVVVGIGVAALVGLVVRQRFCNELTLPPKPAKPSLRDINPDEVLDAAGKSPRTYKGFLERDSAIVGIAKPVQPEAMATVLPYRVETPQRTLAIGEALEVVGLRLTPIVVSGDDGNALALSIENTTDRDVAYAIATEPSRGTSTCHGRKTIPYNAMVVPSRGAEVRGECVYRNGLQLKIAKVETVALAPLQAFYVSMVPPLAVGIEPRLAKGSRPSLPGGKQACTLSLSQAARSALDSGVTTWRDMIDYYARHTCETYRFPDGYKAFERDGERALPVVE